MNKKAEQILVIKLGALGDFIQALGPMRAIRHHHPDAHITLLTTSPFESFARQCGYNDEIWLDKKPGWADVSGWLNLRHRLNKAHFSRIYDLQNNDRSSTYFRLLKKPKPEWVGVAEGASHRNVSPTRTQGHAFDGHVETLALAGVTGITVDRLDWMSADISAFALEKPYALLIPGCAPQHPHKRWPAEHYAQLAQYLAQQKIQPVLIGTKDDQEATTVIAQACPQALDLNSQTNLPQIVALAKNAALAIGNDTGPMHLIAATGLPCLSLFSSRSNPIRHAPKGDAVTILQENNLQDLPPAKVIETIRTLIV